MYIYIWYDHILSDVIISTNLAIVSGRTPRPRPRPRICSLRRAWRFAPHVKMSAYDLHLFRRKRLLYIQDLLWRDICVVLEKLFLMTLKWKVHVINWPLGCSVGPPASKFQKKSFSSTAHVTLCLHNKSWKTFWSDVRQGISRHFYKQNSHLGPGTKRWWPNK